MALTSEFIQRLYYKLWESEDGTMAGYVDFTFTRKAVILMGNNR